MNKYIGITNNKLNHILGVARECYNIARDMGYDENFCQRMFMLGWVHDVGYEFSTTPEEHAIISANMLQLIGVTDNIQNTIRNHTQIIDIPSIEWTILSMADLTIDSKGEKVTVQERLNDIKKRYGEKSPQYSMSYNTANKIGLLTISELPIYILGENFQ